MLYVLKFQMGKEIIVNLQCFEWNRGKKCCALHKHKHTQFYFIRCPSCVAVTFFTVLLLLLVLSVLASDTNRLNWFRNFRWFQIEIWQFTGEWIQSKCKFDEQHTEYTDIIDKDTQTRTYIYNQYSGARTHINIHAYIPYHTVLQHIVSGLISDVHCAFSLTVWKT